MYTVFQLFAIKGKYNPDDHIITLLSIIIRLNRRHLYIGTCHI